MTHRTTALHGCAPVRVCSLHRYVALDAANACRICGPRTVGERPGGVIVGYSEGSCDACGYHVCACDDSPDDRDPIFRREYLGRHESAIAAMIACERALGVGK